MNIVFVCYILCKIIIFFLCWWPIDYLGYLLAIFYLIYAAVKTIRLCIRSNIHFDILMKACVIVMLLLIPNEALQEWKFEILQERYEMKAMEIITDVQDEKDEFYQTYQITMLDRLVFNNLEKDITVYRHEDQYVVSFVKSRTFFSHYAYVYLSSPDAVFLVTMPSKYDSSLEEYYSLEDHYDYLEWIEEGKWALVKWY